MLAAAWTDDVVNRSAALTGGVRHIRYVTDPSGGTCVARVLNVTVPAGSMSSFNATISAVQALGYTDPARKYLMWTDATVLCGVASMYLNDADNQGNVNNGSYAQYARVDAGCWGFGDGASQHSVEAHEVLHTLGGVQNSAPHSTHAGHCWDESDTMCYADGGDHAMVQVCSAEREYLFDCTNDDYFSTYPDPGSYLDTHWNAADSRFLIGGGDGTGGGTPGAPTVLGATIGVNNPAVPGLATQATVTPLLPTGRTVASVQWRSARADCGFSTPTALQTEVQCAATASTSTTVTATVVDSTGATKSVTSPLTFATGTARPVTLSMGAAGQQPADGEVRHRTDGGDRQDRRLLRRPGHRVRRAHGHRRWRRGRGKRGQPGRPPHDAGGQSGLARDREDERRRQLLPRGQADRVRDDLGDPGRLDRVRRRLGVDVARQPLPLKVTGTLSVSYAGAAGQPAASTPIGPVVAGTWSTSINASASASSVAAGGSLVLTGSVARTYDGNTQPAAGVRVSVYFAPAGGSPTLTKTATTTATGTYKVTLYPKATGTWTARLVGVVGHADSAAAPVAVSVS